MGAPLLAVDLLKLSLGALEGLEKTIKTCDGSKATGLEARGEGWEKGKWLELLLHHLSPTKRKRQKVVVGVCHNSFFSCLVCVRFDFACFGVERALGKALVHRSGPPQKGPQNDPQNQSLSSSFQESGCGGSLPKAFCFMISKNLDFGPSRGALVRASRHN